MKTSAQVRAAFLDYFAKQGHQVVPSGSLIPANDPTLMFANAGMVQFKDVFTGREKRPYKRAASSQKCMRVSGKHNDLENVGVTARHHTLFEMLGNFSFGDYFKEATIRFGWEFLTEVLGLDQRRIVVTYFGGEGNLPADLEARDLWKKIAGLPDDRIQGLGAKDNFWSMGDTGPCGPSSEIFYYFGDDAPDPAKMSEEPPPDGRGWMEIWNHVFMQFERDKSGTLTPLPAPSIDTGMGLERVCCAAQGVTSNYDTDLLRPIVDLASELAKKPYGQSASPDDVSMRVIADHARATAFLISEGVFPDREGRPYVLRRVMRRAIRHGHRLGIDELFLHKAALKVVEIMGEHYPELVERRALIEDVTKQEEERFRRTLARGLTTIAENQTWEQASDGTKLLPGAVAFKLYDTYGFPIDLQQVIGEEQGFAIDMTAFEREMEGARERSAGSKVGEKGTERIYQQLAEKLGKTEFVGYDVETQPGKISALIRGGESVEALAQGEEGELIASPTPFYGESGGQVGDRGIISTADGVFEVTDTLKPVEGFWVHKGRVKSGIIKLGDAALAVDPASRAATRRNHSATHLLHLGLRTVLGEQAMQKGSLVGPERLRFDYAGTRPLTPIEIAHIENIANERILANYEVTTHVLPMAEAKARGAIGIFEEKYGAEVRMLTVAPDSIELCGGTHVSRSGDIGMFKIVSEGGLAAGVRRIEAATGFNALAHVRKLESELVHAGEKLKSAPLQVSDAVDRVLASQQKLKKELDEAKQKLLSGGSVDLASKAQDRGEFRVLGAVVDLPDIDGMRGYADQLKDKLQPAVIVLGAAQAKGKVSIVCAVSKELTKRFQAGGIVKQCAALVGGSGGGRPDFAQAGGTQADKLEEAVQLVYTIVG
ncbi:MAG TPA: alanine--tRNA ligase [Polyangiales bacterium]|nr:alanine--tRNA ligase [Polyangiales bacterium]